MAAVYEKNLRNILGTSNGVGLYLFIYFGYNKDINKERKPGRVGMFWDVATKSPEKVEENGTEKHPFYKPRKI